VSKVKYKINYSNYITMKHNFLILFDKCNLLLLTAIPVSVNRNATIVTQHIAVNQDEAYLFYIRTLCVPRCKHSPLRL
jgi:hypothetical protein